MPKPKHIPQAAWDVALELLDTAPDMWSYSICAGGYIDRDGDLPNRYECGDDDDYYEPDYDDEEEE